MLGVVGQSPRDGKRPVAAPSDQALAPTSASASVTWILLAICATAAFPIYMTFSDGITLRSPDVLTLGALLVFAAGHLRGHGLRLVSTPLDLAFAIFWGAMLISAAWSEDKGLYVRALRPWVFATIFFYLLAAIVRDTGGARRVLRLVWLSLTAQAAVAVWQVFAGKERVRDFLGGWGGYFLYEADVIESRLGDFYFNWNLGPDDPIRALGLSITPSGTCLNATTFATLMAVLAVVGLFGWATTVRTRAIVTAVAVLATLLALLSLKRSGWVAMVAPAAFLPVVSRGDRMRAARAALAATGIVTLTILLFPMVGDRLLDRARTGLGEFGASTIAAGDAAVSREFVGSPPALEEPTLEPRQEDMHLLDAPRLMDPLDVPGLVQFTATNATGQATEPGTDASHPRREQGRISLWKFALAAALERPLTGVGLGQWPHHGPWTDTRYGVQRWGNTESFFLGIAAELGFLALAAFLWLTGTLLWLAWRRVRRGGPEASLAAAAGAGLLAIAIGGTVNSLFPGDHVWPVFFALAAVILATSRPTSAARAGPINGGGGNGVREPRT